MNNYCVYMHVSPNNKRYIGITSQQPEHRWGLQGQRYKSNAHFWAAICKYGWQNFQHIIIAENLTHDEACNLEISLIQKFQTTLNNYGYNHTFGGEHNIPNADVRAKLQHSTTVLWQNSEFRAKVVAGLTGHAVSDMTKQRISLAKQGVKLCKPSKLKGIPLSETHRASLCGRVPWNKGLSKFEDARIYNTAQKLTGKIRGESARANISHAQQIRFKDTEYHWITDSKIERFIPKSAEMPDGFVCGRKDKQLVAIHRYYENKFIPFEQLNTYLMRGWSLGRTTDIGSKISQACHNRYGTWVYDNNTFNTANDLAQYLHQVGYPNITDSTITALFKRGFASSKSYSSLANKITKIKDGRILHEGCEQEN